MGSTGVLPRRAGAVSPLAYRPPTELGEVMADARNSWNEAGEKLGELGRKLKVQYESQHGEAQGPSRDELAAAARRVGGAVQDAFEALGTAARDKAVQDDVKQVGKSVVDALGATFGQVSEDVRRAFSERKGDVAARSTDPTVSEPPAAAPPTATPSPAEPPAAEPPAAPPPAAAATGTGDEGDAPPKVEPWGTP